MNASTELSNGMTLRFIPVDNAIRIELDDGVEIIAHAEEPIAAFSRAVNVVIGQASRP